MQLESPALQAYVWNHLPRPRGLFLFHCISAWAVGSGVLGPSPRSDLDNLNGFTHVRVRLALIEHDLAGHRGDIRTQGGVGGVRTADRGAKWVKLDVTLVFRFASAWGFTRSIPSGFSAARCLACRITVPPGYRYYLMPGSHASNLPWFCRFCPTWQL